jgi:hypothetical protein
MDSSILTGQRGLSVNSWAAKKKLDPEFAKKLWEAIEEPDEIPYLLEALSTGFSKLNTMGKEEVRNGLVRIQIHGSIHSNSDPIKVSKQLYLSQIVEKVLFGSNKLMGEGLEDEGPEK